MLKHRVLVAVPLIIIVVAAIYLLPAVVFDAVSALIFLYAGWEWSRLAAITDTVNRCTFVGALLLLMLFAGYHEIPSSAVLWFALAWWLVVASWVFLYPTRTKRFAQGIWARAVTGLASLAAAWLSLTLIFRFSPSALLLLLLLVWGADTGAYFVGRALGRHLLLPAVSPKKTWEGVAGGFIACALIGLIFFSINSLSMNHGRQALLVLFTFIFSILGDLAESMLKREVNLKDSGTLLPGHGGLLDRIDSLIAASTVYAFISFY